jgi:hypothetical protein
MIADVPSDGRTKKGVQEILRPPPATSYCQHLTSYCCACSTCDVFHVLYVLYPKCCIWNM